MTDTWNNKDESKVWELHIGKNGVPYLSNSMLEETGIVRHGFSTRLGGVSEGIFSTMNLSFSRGDDKNDVMENFRRIGEAIDVCPEDMVFSRQTHTVNIREITEADRGKGIMCPVDYDDVDGLITNVPGICLVTFYADCVPLFFVDPVNRAIGLTHSGWRGTVGKIGKRTVERMTEAYQSRPEDVLACIGPSICQDCYEVSKDVIEEFQKQFDHSLWEQLFYEKPNGKYQLDLWKANEEVFLEAGILPEHIKVTNLCTNCNPDMLFSHRASHGKRGNLAAFLELKKSSSEKK